MRLRRGLVSALALGGLVSSLVSPLSVARAEPPSEVPSGTSQPSSSAEAPAPERKTLVPAAVPIRVPPTAEEIRFIELVNQERAKRGLSRLVVDQLLTEVAREHSAEMRDKNYFSHQSPTAAIRTPLDRYLHAMSSRPTYACVGENLFYCSVVDVQRGHKAFMNSPTHRENVLFPRYERIGVGIVKNADGEFWVTQMYLTNRDQISVAKKLSSRK